MANPKSEVPTTIRQKKNLGQNFLVDRELLRSFIAVSQPAITDRYLEIGPGWGSVTQTLAPQVRSVIAVELDHDLIPTLQENLRNLTNITIANADILTWLEDRCYYDTNHDNNINKIIGSIPYQITSPLLHLLCQEHLRKHIDVAALIIQKEVAEKIIGRPPRASYLGTFLQTFFEVNYRQTIPKTKFSPVPQVDGAMIELKRRNNSKIMVPAAVWSKFLHLGFQHPRQMLRQIFDEKVLEKSGIDPTRRPETVNLQKWKQLYENFSKEKI